MTDIDTWWRDLGSAALIGTARRPAPALPALGVTPRPGSTPEQQALDGAALGSVLRRAGTRPGTTTVPGPAPVETQKVAPVVAVQLLELLLDQPPAGANHRDVLLRHWTEAAAGTGHRAPYRVLPRLLDLASPQAGLHSTTAAVVGERGRWLADRNPHWGWVHTTSGPSFDVGDFVDTWDRLPSAERAAGLGQYRLLDPSGARELLRSTWSVDSAKDRAAHLATLAIGLGPHDEEFLETTLDDRAASVKETAIRLLDALPTSARAERMAARLRPLLHVTGMLKRGLEVDLPDDPDATGSRDGLGKPPPGRSQRGWWLEQIAAGAPLAVWTDATSTDPDTLLNRLLNTDARAGVRRAILARRDPTWAAAWLNRPTVQIPFDAEMLGVMAPEARDRAALDRLGTRLGPMEVHAVYRHLPGPWTAALSRAVVRSLAHDKNPGSALQVSEEMLARNLHPDCIPDLERWIDQAEHNGIKTHLRNLISFQTVKRSITEAFE